MEKPFLTRTEAAAYVTSLGLPLARTTLQKMATVGGGPRYRRFGSRAVYSRQDLDEWVRTKLGAPVDSTSELAKGNG